MKKGIGISFNPALKSFFWIPLKSVLFPCVRERSQTQLTNRVCLVWEKSCQRKRLQLTTRWRRLLGLTSPVSVSTDSACLHRLLPRLPLPLPLRLLHPSRLYSTPTPPNSLSSSVFNSNSLLFLKFLYQIHNSLYTLTFCFFFIVWLKEHFLNFEFCFSKPKLAFVFPFVFHFPPLDLEDWSRKKAASAYICIRSDILCSLGLYYVHCSLDLIIVSVIE